MNALNLAWGIGQPSNVTGRVIEFKAPVKVYRPETSVQRLLGAKRGLQVPFGTPMPMSMAQICVNLLGG
jgi:hypothetical protein